MSAHLPVEMGPHESNYLTMSRTRPFKASKFVFYKVRMIYIGIFGVFFLEVQRSYVKLLDGQGPTLLVLLYTSQAFIVDFECVGVS